MAGVVKALKGFAEALILVALAVVVAAYVTASLLHALAVQRQ